MTEQQAIDAMICQETLSRDDWDYCKGSRCMAWRWLTAEDAKPTAMRRVCNDTYANSIKEISRQIRELKCGREVTPEESHRAATLSTTAESLASDAHKHLDCWQPEPPQGEAWEFSDKYIVDDDEPYCRLVATFTRPKRPDERHGYCGKAGAPCPC